MSGAHRSGSERRSEEVISRILLAGVSASALLVIAGGFLYLARHGSEAPQLGAFHGEPDALTTIGGVARGAARLEGRALIQLGLGVLVATPVLRVAYAFYAFLRQRDPLYAVISGVVLCVLLTGFLSAQLGG